MRVWPQLTLLFFLGAVASLLISTSSALAVEANDKPSDLAGIRAGSEAFVKLFNKQDAKGIAALWTTEGEYVDAAGQTFVGRDAIAKEYATFFADHPKVAIRITIDSLRLVSDDVAIEEGHAELDPAPAGTPGYTTYVVVHNKVKNKWLMASVRDTFVAKPSSYESVADFEWLVGTWAAEEHGTQLESVCRWVADKSFVERKYTTTAPDGTKTSGVQIIGWNPLAKHVQSWNFSPGGGIAVGTWTAIDGGYQADMRGMTSEGVPTRAVNLLIRLDDNAYSWKSIQRTVGDIALPDSDEIVIKRQ